MAKIRSAAMAYQSQPQFFVRLASQLPREHASRSLLAPEPHNEDHTRGVDFTRVGIRARRQASYAQARCQALEGVDVDPLAGIVIHEMND